MLAIRLWIGEKLYGGVANGARVSRKRMIKYVHENELEGLRYVAANTTIPVPRLHRVHRKKYRLALEMEFFPDCDNLIRCCRDSYSPQQKQAIVDQVAGFIKQLRELEPSHPHRVSSTDGNACRVIRVSTAKQFGSFDDIASFYECALRGGFPLEHIRASFGDDVFDVHQRNYKTKFTHGDLGVSNILVRNAKVVAVIDWECAGWYPEYWEYTMAHYNYVYLPEFYDMLRGKVDRYDDELVVERALWRDSISPSIKLSLEIQPDICTAEIVRGHWENTLRLTKLILIHSSVDKRGPLRLRCFVADESSCKDRY